MAAAANKVDGYLTLKQKDMLDALRKSKTSSTTSTDNSPLKSNTTTTREQAIKEYFNQTSNDISPSNCVPPTLLAQMELYWKYAQKSKTLYKNATNAWTTIEEMQDSFNVIKSKTMVMQQNCEVLWTELDDLRSSLHHLENDILPYFTSLELIATSVGASATISQNGIQIKPSPSINVISTVTSQLNKIRDCIQFLKNNRSCCSDSQMFCSAYEELLALCLDQINTSVIKSIHTARDKVLNHHHYTSFDNINESWTEYLTFYNIEIVRDDTAASIVVEEAFILARIDVISPILSAFFDTMDDRTEETDDVNKLRLCCNFISRVCDLEQSLFKKLFKESSEKFEAFVINTIGSTLYNAVRSDVISSSDIENLCEVIYVLRGDNTRYNELCLPVLERLVEDAQERLIYITQVVIRDEIEGYVPTRRDLNYPAVLEECINDDNGSNFYASWYPTLEKSLVLLSRVYLNVEGPIFQAIATDVILVCTESLKDASEMIESFMHRKLFLIKNLLTLREQVTPFEIQETTSLTSTTTEAALGNLRGLLGDNGGGGIFDMMSQIVSVQKNSVSNDPKKQLELELKTACSSFIKDATMHILSDFDKKLMRLSRGEKILEVLVQVRLRLDDEIPLLKHYLHLYLGNTDTEEILLSPVTTALTERLLEVKNKINTDGDEIISAAFDETIAEIKKIHS